MMTYYEWVDYLRKLREGPISEESISKINDFPKTPLDILIRFINQIIDLISFRLSTTTDHVVNTISKSGLNYNNLLLEINYIKQEISYVKKLAGVSIINENIRKDILNRIKSYGDDMNMTFKNAFANATNPQIALLVNNLDVNS